MLPQKIPPPAKEECNASICDDSNPCTYDFCDFEVCHNEPVDGKVGGCNGTSTIIDEYCAKIKFNYTALSNAEKMLDAIIARINQ